MAGQSIILAGPSQRQWAIDKIKASPDGYVVRIAEPTRTDLQNRMLHPLLREIMNSQPDRWHGYTLDECKLTFLDALRDEMRMLPKLDGAGYFPVGRKTSTLSKAQFSDLLELVFKYAAEHDLPLRDPRPAEAA